jgi:hypothetical protein
VIGVHVAEDRTEPGVPGGARRGEEGEGGQDDLVAGLGIEGPEGKQDRIRARGASDRVRDAKVRGDLRFQPLDLGTHDEPLGGHDTLDRGIDGVLDGEILRLQVKEWDLHRVLRWDSAVGWGVVDEGAISTAPRLPGGRESGRSGRGPAPRGRRCRIELDHPFEGGGGGGALPSAGEDLGGIEPCGAHQVPRLPRSVTAR